MTVVCGYCGKEHVNSFEGDASPTAVFFCSRDCHDRWFANGGRSKQEAPA